MTGQSDDRLPTPPILLASGSPRRAELLRSIGWDPVIFPTDIDEERQRNESPIEYVERLGREKCAAAERANPALAPGTVLIAADTTVELDGAVLGKPDDRADAIRMVSSLSGRDHHVHTGVCVRCDGRERAVVVSTTVRFAALVPDEVERYVDLGESRDKAGGYAIQGAGAVLIERIDGSPSNVIGLPLRETVMLVRAVLGDPRFAT